MKNRIFFISLLCLLSPLSLSQAFADEEVENSFPSEGERFIHLRTNEARSDPVAALKDCKVCKEKSCYNEPMAPLYWSSELAKAARLHSTLLTHTFAQCGLMHNSPCQLQTNIATTYPSTCDGSPACACSGSVDCAGNGPFERIALFLAGSSLSATGENVAMNSNPSPEAFFMAWLWEPTSSTSCKFSAANGHRYNILNPSIQSIGVGLNQIIATQDFGSQMSATTPISVATAYHDDQSITHYRAHYYAAQKPKSAKVNIDGTCHDLQVIVGSNINGSWEYTAPLNADCQHYRFEFVTDSDATVTYPTTGALGLNCTQSWSEQSLTACGGNDDGGNDDGGSDDGGNDDGNSQASIDSDEACTTSIQLPTSSNFSILMIFSLFALYQIERKYKLLSIFS